MGHAGGGKLTGRLIATKNTSSWGEGRRQDTLRVCVAAPRGREAAGTKVRVTRSDLVLRGGHQLSPKPGCGGGKPILRLFGRINATRATVSAFLVRHNTVVPRGRACVPDSLSCCLGASYCVETGDSVYSQDILEWLERGVRVLPRHQELPPCVWSWVRSTATLRVPRRVLLRGLLHVAVWHCPGGRMPCVLHRLTF